MFTKRIIPCLDVKNGRVVKGVNFVDLKDAGDPVEIAKAYDKAGADEVVFLDITASSDQRGTVVDMVRKVAANVFIPFTVGGGIRTVDDFKMLLREGPIKFRLIPPRSTIRSSLAMRRRNLAASAWSLRSMRRRELTEAAGISTKTAAGSMSASTPSSGRKSREPRSRRNSAHQHGLRRNKGGIRYRADKNDRRERRHPGHRIRRRRNAGAFL